MSEEKPNHTAREYVRNHLLDLCDAPKSIMDLLQGKKVSEAKKGLLIASLQNFAMAQLFDAFQNIKEQIKQGKEINFTLAVPYHLYSEVDEKYINYYGVRIERKRPVNYSICGTEIQAMDFVDSLKRLNIKANMFKQIYGHFTDPKSGYEINISN